MARLSERKTRLKAGLLSRSLDPDQVDWRRFIQPSNPSAEPNSHSAAGIGNRPRINSADLTAIMEPIRA
jgi:hypothetical protein